MATQINFFYSQYVTTMMTIDEDDNGLFVSIPSESNGESYTVRCTEHADHVDVESCQCQGFHYRKSCKHVIIVQNWYNKIYASSIAKASEKALEQAIDAIASLEEVEEMVAFSEQVLAATEKDQTPLIVTTPAPVATPSPVLNGQSQSAQVPAWLAVLPSRKKVEVRMDREAQIEEAKKEILFEEEIARRLSLLKSEKMEGLKFIAMSRNLTVKSRKRIDYINAIIEDIRKSLEAQIIAA